MKLGLALLYLALGVRAGSFAQAIDDTDTPESIRQKAADSQADIVAKVPELVAIDKGVKIPVFPTDDNFYTPADGYESSPLGTVLKKRKLTNPIGTTIFKAHIQATYQIQYRTTDASGHAAVGITTVIVPYNADFTKVLSYQVAEDAAWIGCSVSYGLQQLSNPESVMAQIELLSMDVMLQRGYVVNTPDHMGPTSAFAANRMGGLYTLDAIRALLCTKDFTGVQPDARVAFWGYSGGSFPSAWATELKSSYYPELNLVGTAIGGFVPNLEDIFNHINKGLFSGFIVPAIAGLSTQYPDFSALVDKHILPDRVDDYNKTRSQCLFNNLISYPFQDILSWSDLGDPLLDSPEFQAIVADNQNGKNKPAAPMLIYHGKLDEVAPYQPVLDCYNAYCALGADVEFNVDLTAEHIIAYITGLPRAVQFIEDRMRGVAVAKGCKMNQWLTSALNPQSLPEIGDVLFRLFLAVIGAPIGPNLFGGVGETVPKS